jgi:hypothetical protein
MHTLSSTKFCRTISRWRSSLWNRLANLLCAGQARVVLRRSFVFKSTECRQMNWLCLTLLVPGCHARPLTCMNAKVCGGRHWGAMIECAWDTMSWWIRSFRSVCGGVRWGREGHRTGQYSTKSATHIEALDVLVAPQRLSVHRRPPWPIPGEDHGHLWGGPPPVSQGVRRLSVSRKKTKLAW